MLLSTHQSTVQPRANSFKRSWLSQQISTAQVVPSFGQTKLRGAALVWERRSSRSFGHSWSMLRSPK